MFLERIQAEVPQGYCCAAKLEGLNPKEVLDAVVTEHCEAALVEVSALLAYQEDVPGLGRQLKVLAASEVFPPGVVVYRKGALSVEDVEVLRKGLRNCSRTAAGKAMATFWQLKGFEDVSDAYKKELEEFLKARTPPRDAK